MSVPAHPHPPGASPGPQSLSPRLSPILCMLHGQAADEPSLRWKPETPRRPSPDFTTAGYPPPSFPARLPIGGAAWWHQKPLRFRSQYPMLLVGKVWEGPGTQPPTPSPPLPPHLHPVWVLCPRPVRKPSGEVFARSLCVLTFNCGPFAEVRASLGEASSQALPAVQAPRDWSRPSQPGAKFTLHSGPLPWTVSSRDEEGGRGRPFAEVKLRPEASSRGTKEGLKLRRVRCRGATKEAGAALPAAPFRKPGGKCSPIWGPHRSLAGGQGRGLLHRN